MQDIVGGFIKAKSKITMRMRKTFILIAFVIALFKGIDLQAQVTVTLNVATAGTLSTLIDPSQKNLITSLTLTGNLNGTDILYIREMAGSDVKGNATSGTLSVLDLSGAKIVSGRSAYYVNFISYDYSTSDNSISDYMFRNCTSLTSITIPSSVTTIGYFAFSNCTGLTSITIPSSVTSIGIYAFDRCTGLTYVTIPGSVTSIGNHVFNNCTGLTSITIPNDVTSIGDYAFYNCTGLTSITIPSSVTSIGQQVFYNCTGLTQIIVDSNNSNFSSLDGVLFNKDWTLLIAYPNGKSEQYTIPNSVTSIGNYAFYDCTGLTSITIPNSVTSISANAFSNCTGLTSITIPNSVTSIGDDAFWFCSITTLNFNPTNCTSIGSHAFTFQSSLKTVNIGDNVKTLPNNLFSSCTGLTSITIPNSVTSIGDHAFYGCRGLTSIIIPDSVTSIGDYAFYDCTGLTEVHSNNITPPNASYNTFSGINKATCKLYIPENSYSAYTKATGWNYFINTFEVNHNGSILYNITTNCNEGGVATINELNKISITIEEGKSGTITFLPNEGYILSTVLLNENDITSNISNNSYIIPSVTQNQVFNVTFKKIALATTVTAGEGGQAILSSQSVDYGNSVTLTITPNEGYVVDKVTKNSTDITDSIANNAYTATGIKMNIEFVVFFKMYTDISQAQRKNIKIYTDQDAIVVTGIDSEKNISVYTCSGILLQIIKATDNMVRINLPPNHIYIVNTMGKTFKVAL